jgi:hypothetical protein
MGGNHDVELSEGLREVGVLEAAAKGHEGLTSVRL